MFEGFKDGDTISAVVRVALCQTKKDRNGNDYVNLRLDDGHNEIQAFAWDPKIFQFKKDQVIKVKGRFGHLGDKPKIDVESAEETQESIRLPGISDTERARYSSRFKEIMASINDPDYKLAMETIFGDPDLWDRFIWAPAATHNHEGYRGGLLKHTVEVTERCLDEYERNPLHLDRDLLICGAFMHDFGKIVEYQWERSFDRTTYGKLVGHIQIANITLGRMLPDDFPTHKAMMIYHLIISHQGKKEWGSPIEPLCKEALVVHFADMMRSYTAHFDEMYERNQGNEWSEWDRVFGRSWYLHSSGDHN